MCSARHLRLSTSEISDVTASMPSLGYFALQHRVAPPRKAYSLTSSAFLESGTPCPFLLFAPVFRGSLMLKFQKILDKSRIGVYNHIVRSYSRTADQKCVDGCGFPPHAESAFTESCRLVQGSKASACDPPVADSPNPRCTYGRHGDTGVWLPPR